MHKSMYNQFLRDKFKLKGNIKKGFIKEGYLINEKDKIKIKNYIPRFVDENYCESFSLQWNKFKDLQLDSKNGYNHSMDRIKKCTKWNLKDLKGKSLLECGCGPGRFTEIFLKAGAKVVAVDMSSAVDANLENNGMRKNLLLIQGDIINLPFLHNKFDYVFCYGVIQHTPNPRNTFDSLVRYLKKGGKISIDNYRRVYLPTGWSTPKYLWRPITKRMNKEKLLKFIECYIPKYIDFDTKIRKIPKIGIILTGIIPVPCWNYLKKGYTRKERIEHAIMDTFDALSPTYDKPKTAEMVRRWFIKNNHLNNIEVFTGFNGIIGNAMKK